MKENIDTDKIKLVLEKTPFKKYTLEKIDKGVSTNVFKLTNLDTYYLKILSKKESLSPILLVNKLLLKQKVKVPKIVFTLKNSTILNNRDMYIEKELNGESIKNTTLSEEEKNIIIQKAGKDLAKLNSIEVKGVGWIEGTKNNQLYSKGKDYDDFIIRNIRNMLNKFIEIKILSNEQADKITEYIQSNKEFIDIKDNSYLAHGDFCIEHIYHANGKYSGIIDFGDIRGTSKYHDLAHFYTYNRKYFKSLVEGYNSIYKLTTDCIDKVKIEAVIFAVGKLWWVSQNKLHKIENHPALDLFEEIVY
jgi:hypothetical protein